MTNVTQKFTGPTKIEVGVLGYDKKLVFKIKEDGFLDIRNGAIVGYRGVSPQPFTLRQVIGISSAEYSYPDTKKSTKDQVKEIADAAKN